MTILTDLKPKTRELVRNFQRMKFKWKILEDLYSYDEMIKTLLENENWETERDRKERDEMKAQEISIWVFLSRWQKKRCEKLKQFSAQSQIPNVRYEKHQLNQTFYFRGFSRPTNRITMHFKKPPANWNIHIRFTSMNMNTNHKSVKYPEENKVR